jgi:hypothetical protein
MRFIRRHPFLTLAVVLAILFLVGLAWGGYGSQQPAPVDFTRTEAPP